MTPLEGRERRLRRGGGQSAETPEDAPVLRHLAGRHHGSVAFAFQTEAESRNMKCTISRALIDSSTCQFLGVGVFQWFCTTAETSEFSQASKELQ